MKKILLFALITLISGCNGSLKKPIEIPSVDALGLKGKLVIAPESGVQAEITLYNGTDWNVTDIFADITNKKTNETRKYHFIYEEVDTYKRNDKGAVIDETMKKSFVAPAGSGHMDADIGDFLDDVKTDGNYAWSIENALGFKP